MLAFGFDGFEEFFCGAVFGVLLGEFAADGRLEDRTFDCFREFAIQILSVTLKFSKLVNERQNLVELGNNAFLLSRRRQRDPNPIEDLITEVCNVCRLSRLLGECTAKKQRS